MNKKVLDIFFPIFVFLLSILAIYLVFGNLISKITVTSETLYMPFVSYLPNTENADYFWRMFLSSDHSWFLASFVLHLFSRIIPSFTGNNPQDFYLESGWCGFFAIFCVFLYVMTINASKYFKSRFTSVFIFWFIFPFIVFNIQSANFIWGLYNDTWFVCYFFNSIFSLLLLQIMEKYYVTQRWFFFLPAKENISPNKFVHYAKVVGIITLVFLTGIGHELYKFVFLGTLILGLFFHKLFVKTKIHYKLYICFIIVAIIMNSFVFLIPTFHDWFNSNVKEFSLLMSFLQTNKAFFEYVVYGNIWKLIFIPAFLVYAHFAVEDKEQTKRLIVSIASSYISILIFNYIIIFLTDCDLDISQHYGIRFLTKTILLTLLFSSIGFVLSKSSEKFKKITYISFITFFVSWCTYFCFNGWLQIMLFNEDSVYIQENQYLVDKFYDLYGKEHNVIYATKPLGPYCEHSYYYFKHWYGGNDKPYKIKFVCKQEDSNEVCQQKLIKKIYEKTHFRIYEDDLEDFDFSEIESYKKRRAQGKFKIKFF